jgi:AraC-like DNA-binding protein
MSLRDSLRDFDPDRMASPVKALRVEVSDNEAEVPVHRHRKGQLVLALRGSVTCEVPDALWIVPPQSAVWIPGGMPHSNRATADARIYFLSIDPEAAALPVGCCTLSVTPMLREMIRHLAGLPPDYPADGPTARLVGVLLEELARMPVERINLPVSDEPRIRRMSKALANDPSDRSTLAQWADRLAMSERSLARLLVRETGLTFGRWRQQLHLIVALGKLAAGASVQQVSEALGYESVTAFITMFKKTFGKPPAKYIASITS